MFTGIVRAIGVVTAVHRNDSGGGGALVIDPGALEIAGMQVGDSLAVNGACLTVTELGAGHARFDISAETMAKCLVGEWRTGDRLNLEPSLTLQTPLGGHLVAGHIDGLGALIERRAHEDCVRMQFSAPRAIGNLIAAKGSIAVDGVSLTVNEVRDERAQTCFAVMVVPHTLATTTLGAMQPRARVHLEADPLARYVQRFMTAKCGD